MIFCLTKIPYAAGEAFTNLPSHGWVIYLFQYFVGRSWLNQPKEGQLKIIKAAPRRHTIYSPGAVFSRKRRRFRGEEDLNVFVLVFLASIL